MKRFQKFTKKYSGHYSFSFDHYRHWRMWSRAISGVSFNGADVLVVGDARDCFDAKMLSSMLDCNVTSSTYYDSNLRDDTVEKFSVSDIDLEDPKHLEKIVDKYDYIVCKEVLHHLRDPLIAIRNLAKLAKRGIICIEPADRAFEPGILAFPFYIYKYIARRLNLYEDDGNYLYCFSRREIEKFFSGSFEKSNLSFIWFNDIYINRFKPYKPFSIKFYIAYFLSSIFNGFMETLGRLNILKPTHIVIKTENLDSD